MSTTTAVDELRDAIVAGELIITGYKQLRLQYHLDIGRVPTHMTLVNNAAEFLRLAIARFR